MYTNYTNINDGSTFSIDKQELKKTPNEELINESPFEQLFTKQRNYIQSEEVRAIKDINLKKQSYLSETEIDILTGKPSREQLNSVNNIQQANTAFQSFDHQITQTQIYENNHSQNNHTKNFFETKKDKSIIKNGDDYVNFSFDVDLPSLNNSPNPSNIKSKIERQPQKEHTVKGGFMKEKLKQQQNSMWYVLLLQFNYYQNDQIVDNWL